jgi:cystathionine beta-lyase/cystathionine gamma-synthase
MPRPDSPPSGPLSPAVQRASAFAFASAAELRPYGHGERHGDFYPRYVHRNGQEFEEQIAALESTAGAVAFASGMAAISGAILAHCGSGDRVLIARQVYGGTDALARHDLPRLGITVDRFDALAAGELVSALSRPAKVVLVETPINPMLRVSTSLQSPGCVGAQAASCSSMRRSRRRRSNGWLRSAPTS